MSILNFTALPDLAGKRILIRADLNVPFGPDGEITDDTRIRASLPAIRHALDAGAAVMVASHLGRPKEGIYSDADSLLPVARRLSELLGRVVPLCRDWVRDNPVVKAGHIVLLENCRFNAGEKQNDDGLARRIAALCDVYVNDAFGTAHRAEATTHGVARFAPLACAGPLMAAELAALGKALHQPKGPVVAIVGGSKVSTKLSVLASLADKVDHLIVGGGIANTFLLAMGYRVGASLAEPAMVAEAKAIMSAIRKKGGTVPLPFDVVCAKRFAVDAEATEKTLNQLDSDDMILDIGRRSAEGLAALIERAGTVLWNGPVGVFEIPQFSNGTRLIGEAIARSGAFSIAGGGDTLAAVAHFGLTGGIDYISTGGGAFLEFIEGKSLPAVAILEERGQEALTC